MSKIDKGLSKSIETLQDQVNEYILHKRLEIQFCINIMNQLEERFSAK